MKKFSKEGILSVDYIRSVLTGMYRGDDVCLEGCDTYHIQFNKDGYFILNNGLHKTKSASAMNVFIIESEYLCELKS